MKNIAIILASGSGTRMKLTKQPPKQFIKVKGKMILEYSLDVFQNNKNIDEICIVYKKGFLNFVKPLLKKYPKLKKLLVGGEERFDSSYIGISAYKNKVLDNTNILIHDAVRPLINDTLIDNLIKYLKDYDTVVPVSSSTDTLVKSNANNFFEILNREEIFRVQTPQAFKYMILFSAYDKFIKAKKITKFTDDTSLIRHYYPNVSIKLLLNSFINYKITNSDDLKIIKCFL